MQKIYSPHQKKNYAIKTSVNKIKFLLDYSKSLSITEANGIQYESNLN